MSSNEGSPMEGNGNEDSSRTSENNKNNNNHSVHDLYWKLMRNEQVFEVLERLNLSADNILPASSEVLSGLQGEAEEGIMSNAIENIFVKLCGRLLSEITNDANTRIREQSNYKAHTEAANDASPDNTDDSDHHVDSTIEPHDSTTGVDVNSDDGDIVAVDGLNMNNNDQEANIKAIGNNTDCSCQCFLTTKLNILLIMITFSLFFISNYLRGITVLQYFGTKQI